MSKVKIIILCIRVELDYCVVKKASLKFMAEHQNLIQVKAAKPAKCTLLIMQI